MRPICQIAVLLAIGAPCSAQEFDLTSMPLKNSDLYNAARARKGIVQRIRAGIYDDYTVDLGVDNPKACEAAVFQPYKQSDGKYSLKLRHGMWQDLPGPVRRAIVREIEYYTWGHINRQYNPLVVRIKGGPQGASPLDHLSIKSRHMFVTYGRPQYLVGGKGGDAYGPNCWYNSISAISDRDCRYAQGRKLRSGHWKSPRFMGPTEFRQHMKHFVEVQEPQFGDVVRYYTDNPVYGGLVYCGEVHAAIYVGRESCEEANGAESFRHIVLTKNGRSDLDFLIFQDIRHLDEIYASGRKARDGFNVKKGYFRVRDGARILDPATADESSDAYDAYLVDLRNYRKRWACLAGRIPPPTEGSCYSFPTEWELPSTVAGR